MGGIRPETSLFMVKSQVTITGGPGSLLLCHKAQFLVVGLKPSPPPHRIRHPDVGRTLEEFYMSFM